MEHEIFRFVLRKSQKQLTSLRVGCEVTDGISICEIENETLIIPGMYLVNIERGN